MGQRIAPPARRNGVSVAPLRGVGGDQTTFKDDDVRAGETYAYEVRARAGGAVSEPISAEVKVPVPPLSAAAW
jgi:hypothetical protein